MVVELRAAESGRQPALLLRPWGSEDIQDLLEIYRDPVMSTAAGRSIASEEDACRWLERQQTGWADDSRLSFAVLCADAAAARARAVGNVVLKGRSADKDSAEVGYWTAAAARGRGVASAAVVTLTTWAFEVFGPHGLRRIELIHQLDNVASCRVAQKSEYALTGILPAEPPAFPLDGHLHTRYSPG